MVSNIIITPTNQIENARIEKYLELLSTNVVVGTNFFSDFGAALSDIFGGYSDIYQSKLQKIYNTAMRNLQQQASKIGANAIVGLKIDFDEISGKGKSMFMVSAIGMAVKVIYKDMPDRNTAGYLNDYVSDEVLENEIIKNKVKILLNKNKLPDNEHWNFLLNNPINDIVPVLLNQYIGALTTGTINYDQKGTLLANNLSAYLKICDESVVADEMYSKVGESSEIVKIIDEIHLFSPKHILKLIHEGNIGQAIKCLNIRKSVYTVNDLHLMESILIDLDALPDKGAIESVKGGLLSKAKEKYKCPNGHLNPVEFEYCESQYCEQNIKGLTKSEVNKIEDFRNKVHLLRLMINQNKTS